MTSIRQASKGHFQMSFKDLTFVIIVPRNERLAA